jgi:CIC family chloride channel protein
VVSSVTVRRIFGYSFATWRFHLRGETIRSAVDVGWIRNLTVGRMMRREVPTVSIEATLDDIRAAFPLGSAPRVVALDRDGRYAGIVWLSDVHAAGAVALSDVLHHPHTVLLAEMNVRAAMQLFERAEADALAVVDGASSMRVIGMLTEQYALRRYAEELDRWRRDVSGE